MGLARNWTSEELSQLNEEWGKYSIPTIAERHNRSVNAIKVKAAKLQLGALLNSSEWISLNALVKELKISYGYKTQNLIDLGLKVHKQRVVNNTFKMVDIEEFWKFAEKNRHAIDFSRLEKNALGKEPSWVDKKRKEDFKRVSAIKPHNSEWSAAEDAELIMLLRQFRFGFYELSQRLHRSCGAIQRRCVDLGIKERPVKADNHVKWTEAEYALLCKMIKGGSNYENISLALGKSSKAIRGKVYTTYLSENLNVVSKTIGNGSWGDNRPERNLSQYKLMTLEEKQEVKASVTALASILAYGLRKQFNDQDNWQRNLCQHWNDVMGCSKGETDCDSCSQFQRIQPQNCVRCGKTFYERQSNRMCESCRVQRKKLGYRKYIMMKNKNKAFRKDDENND